MFTPNQSSLGETNIYFEKSFRLGILCLYLIKLTISAHFKNFEFYATPKILILQKTWHDQQKSG